MQRNTKRFPFALRFGFAAAISRRSLPARRKFFWLRSRDPATLAGYTPLQKTACCARFCSPTLQSTSMHSSYPRDLGVPARDGHDARDMHGNEKQSKEVLTDTLAEPSEGGLR
ncbi:hypothetical protein [Burkholderia stagnalis]|uniref:hypothetical protein n=1 Tax=Burkholderia stagnalis TaxID=1503054 RepID=UPI000AF99A34|nr:hypothetical protein [Burkholderia stagnalis]